MQLMGEVRGAGERFLSGGDLIVNAGLRQELSPHLKLLAAAGTGLRGGPETTRFVAYLGIQLLIGNKP